MRVKVQDLAEFDAIESALKSAGKLNGTDHSSTPPKGPSLVSATELYNGEFVILRPLFDGMAWDGLTMIIARPKAGKSWLTLQAAIHIAGGRQVEGMTALGHGPVLYGAFEEPAGRTMSRLKMLAAPGEWTANLHFLYELLPLMGGGAEQLASMMERLKPRLVVLDTLTAVVKGGGKRENDVFRGQYAEVSRIRKLAEDFKTAVILVHHVRKGVSDSGIEAIAGTGGMGAGIDTLWHLKRKPEGEATLDIVGRESEEKTFALKFGQDPFGWRVLGDDAAQLLNAERRQVLCLASTILPGQRQLFFPINDNYELPYMGFFL